MSLPVSMPNRGMRRTGDDADISQLVEHMLTIIVWGAKSYSSRPRRAPRQHFFGDGQEER
jgi:hypothetical protein